MAIHVSSPRGHMTLEWTVAINRKSVKVERVLGIEPH
jgi:hypothetical protein